MDEADRRGPPSDAEAEATVHDLHAEHDNEEVGIQDRKGDGPVVLPEDRHEAHDRERADDDPQDERLDRGATEGSSVDAIVRVAHRFLERVPGRGPYTEDED